MPQLHSEMLPPTVNCPLCGVRMDLDDNERLVKKFECPACKKAIDLTGFVAPNTGPRAMTDNHAGGIEGEEGMTDQKPATVSKRNKVKTFGTVAIFSAIVTAIILVAFLIRPSFPHGRYLISEFTACHSYATSERIDDVIESSMPTFLPENPNANWFEFNDGSSEVTIHFAGTEQTIKRMKWDKVDDDNWKASGTLKGESITILFFTAKEYHMIAEEGNLNYWIYKSKR